jgi:hypothetical protein
MWCNEMKGHAMLSKCLSAALAAVVTMSQAEAAAPPSDHSSAPRATVSLRPTPLPPAGAAPIREAQGVGRPLLYWAAAGAAIIAGVLLLHQDADDTTATPSTGN